ncbi:hypothetical protein [uncultured Methanobrevibacter sp.]|uniref:hypothetical protein n=1 Tax=uncultured Methanobrevibacter sp. TaxID=253161 RepID=UPI0025FAB3EB|nr:hypothetical protein [uncultured Methanobrevibacter sp.]
MYKKDVKDNICSSNYIDGNLEELCEIVKLSLKIKFQNGHLIKPNFYHPSH